MLTTNQESLLIARDTGRHVDRAGVGIRREPDKGVASRRPQDAVQGRSRHALPAARICYLACYVSCIYFGLMTLSCRCAQCGHQPDADLWSVVLQFGRIAGANERQAHQSVGNPLVTKTVALYVPCSSR